MVDLFTLYRRYFAAATLGAHSNFNSGFRQKDVRFLIGLFLNWMDATTKAADESIHNTQISRYLDGLVQKGFATRTGQARTARYQVTRTGLVELIGQLTQVPVRAPLEQFFFAYYFVRTYGERLTDLVAQKENRLPRSFQVELAALLDHRELLSQQSKAVELEIRKLDERIAETKGAHDLAKKFSKTGKSTEEIIRLTEEQFPYDLHHAKPMSELLYEVPPELRLRELTQGNENRVELLWSPMRAYLQNYSSVLQKLARGTF